jgi:shikimate kinase
MMDLMNTHGTTIYLKLSPEVLKTRLIQSRAERPLIMGKSEPELLDFIKSLLEKRELFYKRAAHIVNGINLQPQALENLLLDS